MSGIVHRFFQRLRPHAARPWFPFVMGVSAAADYVFFAASPQLLLIATVLLRGQRWHIVPWCFASLSALGAVAVALGGAILGESILAEFGAEGSTALPTWMASFIETWGGLALFGLCALPLSMCSPVFLAALGGLPAVQIGVAVLAGRLIAYHLLAVVTAFAPSKLVRIPRLASWLDSFGVGTVVPDPRPSKKHDHHSRGEEDSDRQSVG